MDLEIIKLDRLICHKPKQTKNLQNCKCRLCGDKNETINHLISDCSKLAQKSRYDWGSDPLGIVQEI